MNKSTKFSPEVRERAIRLVQEHRGEYPSWWAREVDGTEDRLCTADPARRGARQDGAHDGERPQGTVATEPCQLAVPCRVAGSALGLGFHLCLDRTGLALRSLRH